MQNTLEKWITKINSASFEKLQEIKSEWSVEGIKFNPNDWYEFWRAVSDRELMLNGCEPTDREF